MIATRQSDLSRSRTQNRVRQLAPTGRFHRETGLDYDHARCYKRTFGIWTQRDPAGYIDGLSLYQYVQSNPTTYTDPTGMCEVPANTPTGPNPAAGPASPPPCPDFGAGGPLPAPPFPAPPGVLGASDGLPVDQSVSKGEFPYLNSPQLIAAGALGGALGVAALMSNCQSQVPPAPDDYMKGQEIWRPTHQPYSPAENPFPLPHFETDLDGHIIEPRVEPRPATRTVLDTKETVVHIWHATKEDGCKSMGHASVTLSDGNYISWWPSDPEHATPKNPNWPGVAHKTLSKDVVDEGRKPDVNIRIFKLQLDVQAIEDWWRDDRAENPNWNFYSHNCATVVRDALQIGARGTSRMRLWGDVPASPGDVENYARILSQISIGSLLRGEPIPLP